MKKGFTLLELIVVIVIIGILATLGFAQYSRMIERSRGAEARAVLGAIRTSAAAYMLEHNNNVTGFNNAAAGIGTDDSQIPSSCRTSHYFSYAVSSAGGSTLVATANRCTGSGRDPNYVTSGGGSAPTLNITAILNASGSDSWGGTGGY